MISLFKNSTGYKRLDAYVLMNIIQLETLVFCRRFLNWKTDDPCGRQFDQMTQAARSGVKNLTEGCERGATSAQTMLKLIDVAKASLCELRDDYMTWLLDRNLPPWPQRSAEAQAIFKVLLDKADYGDDVNYDVARHIIAMRERFKPWFGHRQQSTALDGHRQQSIAIDGSRQQSIALGSDRQQSTAPGSDRQQSVALDGHRQQSTAIDSARESEGIVFANAMLILIGRVLNMLSALLASKGEEFRVEGGFSERLTAARVEARRDASHPVDEDAPSCPKCGATMRVRHGRNGDFWGCTAYPTCCGTMAIGSGR